MSKNEDGPLAQIRRIRHEISEESGHDPNRLVDYYVALQLSHGNRLLETVQPKEDAAKSPHNIGLEPTAQA